MKGAVKRPGALHERLGIPKGETIPFDLIESELARLHEESEKGKLSSDDLLFLRQLTFAKSSHTVRSRKKSDFSLDPSCFVKSVRHALLTDDMLLEEPLSLQIQRLVNDSLPRLRDKNPELNEVELLSLAYDLVRREHPVTQDFVPMYRYVTLTRREVETGDFEDGEEYIFERVVYEDDLDVFEANSFETFDRAFENYEVLPDWFYDAYERLYEPETENDLEIEEIVDEIYVRAVEGDIDAQMTMLDVLTEDDDIGSVYRIENDPKWGPRLVADGVNTDFTGAVASGGEYTVRMKGDLIGENLFRDGFVVQPTEIIDVSRNGIPLSEREFAKLTGKNFKGEEKGKGSGSSGKGRGWWGDSEGHSKASKKRSDFEDESPEERRVREFAEEILEKCKNVSDEKKAIQFAREILSRGGRSEK